MSTDRSIRILASELPLDGSLFGVTRLLPRVNFALQEFSAADAPIQALPTKNAYLDLVHVQATRMLGRVVKSQSVQQFAGGTLAQYVVKAPSEVGVQVVYNRSDESMRRLLCS